MIFKNFSGRFQAVHFRHGTIHHHHLRMQFLRQADGFGAIARFTCDHDIGLVFQNAAEPAAHQAVVIHQQD